MDLIWILIQTNNCKKKKTHKKSLIIQSEKSETDAMHITKEYF